MNETYRGVVRGGTIVLMEKDTPLAEGTEVLVTPVVFMRGSSAAILAALGASPQIPTGWVGELEHLTAQGRRPSLKGNPPNQSSV
jgi:hypothetical protein